jgi:hypothetical protein
MMLARRNFLRKSSGASPNDDTSNVTLWGGLRRFMMRHAHLSLRQLFSGNQPSSSAEGP